MSTSNEAKINSKTKDDLKSVETLKFKAKSLLISYIEGMYYRY